jgi:hypothetical protein
MAPSPPRVLAIWSVALWTILLAFIATSVSALDESQAGVIDWYLSSPTFRDDPTAFECGC